MILHIKKCVNWTECTKCIFLHHLENSEPLLLQKQALCSFTWRVKFRWLRIFSGGEPWGRIKQSFSCLVQITEYLSPKWLLPAFKTRSVPSGEGQFPKLARCLMGFHSNLNSSVICMTSVLSFTRWCQWLKLSSERLHTPGWAPGKHTQLEMYSGLFSPSSCLHCTFPGTYSLLGQYPSEKHWNYPAWLRKHICHFSSVTDIKEKWLQLGWAVLGLTLIQGKQILKVNKNQWVYSVIVKAKNRTRKVDCREIPAGTNPGLIWPSSQNKVSCKVRPAHSEL